MAEDCLETITKLFFGAPNAIFDLSADHRHADSGHRGRAANQPADLEARRKALNDLLHEQWEYTMRTNPIYASILGDKRYNDKLDDFSQQGHRRQSGADPPLPRPLRSD